ncbi:MAG: putative Ig domain-containing protein [Bacteroidota bacterium]
MRNSFLTTVLLFLTGSFALAQSIPPDSLYFGQTPPGNIPQVFAPGIVSKPGLREAVIAFSPDGATVFFHIQFYPQPGIPYIMFSTYTNNHWTVPDTIPFTIGRTAAEPFFAFNGTRVYMYATNAINHVGIADLSYSENQGNDWSNPISMGNPPNSETYQYHPCIVGDTSVYFSSGAGQVCRSQYINGAYQSRVILPKPVNYVGSQTWGDPFVSPDESYMIFKSIRPGGFGQNDLYISYRKTDGSWTNPKNLGNVINTAGDETSGDITPDGLYMTYGRNNDLYWVSSSFTDSLKYTNFLPYVKNTIPNQIAFKGQFFDYTIPDTTFIDDDGNNTLTYDANLIDGNPLPGWLSFDTLTASFTGTPPITETLVIRVTATDTAGASASTTLKITVTPVTSTDQITGKCEKVTIFPNPTEGLINVSLDDFSDKTALAEISNLMGEILHKKTFENSITMDLAGKPKGLYFLKLKIDNEVLIRKVCIK